MTPEPEEKVLLTGTAEEVNAASARRTRRSFLVGGAASAAAAGAAYWIDHTPMVGRLQSGLRAITNANAAIARAVFHERGLAPEYPLSAAVPLRLNGSIGMGQTLVPSSWRLQLVGAANAKQSPLYVPDVTAWEYKYAGDMMQSPEAADVKSAPGNGKETDPNDKDDDTPSPSLNPTGAKDSDAGAAIAARFEAMAKQTSTSRKRNVGDDEAGASYSSLDIGTPGLLLTMDDLLKLPRVDKVMQFKCIEGWSNITHWSGVRLRDLLEMYPPEKINGREPRYVYMETPDGNYYGGYDLAAARHPQALLVTHMHGEPLTQEHGAPLRLFMPIKYGYKHVKRIGLIAYTDRKPDDYWTKLGYDWYAGL